MEDNEEDTGPKEIKFRRDQDVQEDLESVTGQKIKISREDDNAKPLIQEIKSSSTSTETAVAETKNEEKPVEVLPSYIPFNWDTAVKVEGVHQFFHTKEFVFLNMPMKGYSKLCDVRYALQQNELLIEVKEPVTQKVHRICKTLLKEVSVDQSSVELLVDFIAVKLRKEDKEQAWDQLGYDIKEFTIPKRGQMKSNFLTLPVIKEEPKPVVANEHDAAADKEYNADESNKPSTEELEEIEKEKKVQKVMSRMNRQLCYLNLESANQIFKIY